MRNVSKILKSALTAMLALALAGFAFGCAAPATEQSSSSSSDAESSKPMTSREYMSQMSVYVEELDEELEGFEGAVSREDSITMRTQAENSFAVLDKMAALEAPEGLEELHDDYIKACDKMKMALNAYVNLYTEITTATDQNPFDYSTYSARLEGIQDQYDDAIESLEEADKLATEL